MEDPVANFCTENGTYNVLHMFKNFIMNIWGLILLQIVHTHPDFGPQPSSVDLHKLYDVQRENLAAISLIISPEQWQCPIYSLTHLGMTRIGNCSSSSCHTFHCHNSAKRALYVVTSDSCTIYEDIQYLIFMWFNFTSNWH